MAGSCNKSHTEFQKIGAATKTVCRLIVHDVTYDNEQVAECRQLLECGTVVFWKVFTIIRINITVIIPTGISAK